jgi:2'-5' RNA ligase
LILRLGLTVNGLKPDKYRFCIFYMLDDLAAGQSFSPEALHLTIAPWFVLPDESEQRVSLSFMTRFLDVKKINTKIDIEVSLGPREDISVYLVEPTNEISDLHAEAIGWLDSLGARWAVKNPYVKDEYKPHIRKRSNYHPALGQGLIIDNLCLIRANRRPDDKRLIEAKVELK